MNKVFITGGSGFIGRNLTEQLGEAFALTAPTSTELNLLDSENVKEYLEQHRFDTVIHCATHDASRNSKKDQSMVFYNNLRMFVNLARCHRSFGKMLYFGSGAEFDAEHYIPQMQEDYFGTFVPKNDYGFSKYIMGQYINQLPNVYDLRIFACFGKYEDWEIRFISNAICKVVHDLDITMRQNVFFDYLYVNDLVRIVKWFIEQGRLEHRHYNVCTGKPVDLFTLAQNILKASGKQLEIRVDSPGFKPEYSGDNSRLMKEMGGFEFTPVDQAIKELYDWYESRKIEIPEELLLIDK